MWKVIVVSETETETWSRMFNSKMVIWFVYILCYNLKAVAVISMVVDQSSVGKLIEFENRIWIDFIDRCWIVCEMGDFVVVC